MSQIVGYMAHDVLGNTEKQLETFDPEALSAMESAGIAFVAVYDDGDRKLVKASEVTEPEPTMNGVTLVTPVYVDARTQATVAVFDALTVIVDPEASASAASATEESDETPDPLQAFKTALDALKALE